ncbi:SDR family NAD(P)-dependent oxidoreductase [Chloroflexota bacterium]
MSMTSFSLEGRVALITGARRGLGKAFALAMAEAGADVAVSDYVLETGELEAVAEEIRKIGRNSIAVQADVTRKSDVDNLVAKTIGKFGVIDILLNNAGVGSDPAILETSEEEWHRVININLTSILLCSQAVSKGMMERKRGSIISIASCAGIRGFSTRNTYNVSKAGVVMLTKVLARDLGKYNVRVNAIAPSMVGTPMTEDFFNDPEKSTAEARRIPLGRLGEVSDLVGPAIFLASDAASYISAHTLVVDGGQLA